MPFECLAQMVNIEIQISASYNRFYVGVEIDDCMMIEDDDILFLSNGADFQTPFLENNYGNYKKASAGEAIPHVIGGYKVGKFLGRGGFGEVRVGEHQLTGEKVALKFLRKDEIMSIGAAERTTTEIQCLTAMRHHNIIRLQQVRMYHFQR